MSRSDAFVARCADFLMAWRRSLGVLFALVTLAFGISATQVRLDPGFLKLIPVKHEYMQTMMAYMDDFSGANTILVNLRWTGEGEAACAASASDTRNTDERPAMDGSAEPCYDDIYNPIFMEALRKATDEVFFIPGINRTKVSSIFTPNVYYIEITEAGFKGEPVVPARYSGTPEELDRVRKNVEHSGQIGQLVANNLKGAMIRADLHEYDPEAGVKVDYWEVQKKLEDIRNQFESENIEVNIIGFSRLLGDVIKGLIGVFAFFALAFAITVVLLYWYTRSVRITVVGLVVALLPVLWLIGGLPLIGYGIDPMSILVPFLIFSIGVSHAVQMTSAWRTEVMTGKTAPEAAHGAFTKLFIPGAVALLTEALGFGVIMFIDIPIVHELGITACLGVLLMIITNKMILPILLSYLTLEDSSRAHAERAEQRGRSKLIRMIGACAEPRCALIVFGVSLVLLAAATWESRDLVIGDTGQGVPELHEDSRYNRDSAKIAASYDIGVDVLTVIAEAREFEGDSCLHHEVVGLLDRLELYVRGIEGVQSVVSVAGVGKLVISAFNEGNPRWAALPRTQVGLSTGSKAFDPNLGLNTEGCKAIQILIFMKDHEGATIAHAMNELKAFIADNPVDGVNLRLASGNVGVMAATNEAVGAAEARMLLSIFGALVLFCLVTFRSWIAVVCVMIPLTMVCVFCNGLMAMLDIGLKVATLPVAALAVGIGVDYGIYIYSTIEEFVKKGMSLADAYYETLRMTGKPVMFTGLVLSGSVATWLWSGLQFQADMGLLLTFAFFANMLGAVFVCPALCRYLMKLPNG